MYFNLNNTTTIRRDLEDAFAEVACKHNIEIKVDDWRFDARAIKVSAKCVARNINGVAETTEEIMFKSLAPRYGLEPSDLNRTFIDKRSQFQIIGISPNRPKSPINLKRLPDGKSFKASADFVRHRLGRTDTTRVMAA